MVEQVYRKQYNVPLIHVHAEERRKHGLREQDEDVFRLGSGEQGIGHGGAFFRTALSKEKFYSVG